MKSTVRFPGERTDANLAAALPPLSDLNPSDVVIRESYLFLAPAIGGKAPLDDVPDPSIEFTGTGIATLAISRFSSPTFGDYDEVTH
jgi:hypothetical protein